MPVEVTGDPRADIDRCARSGDVRAVRPLVRRAARERGALPRRLGEPTRRTAATARHVEQRVRIACDTIVTALGEEADIEDYLPNTGCGGAIRVTALGERTAAPRCSRATCLESRTVAFALARLKRAAIGTTADLRKAGETDADVAGSRALSARPTGNLSR